jgi:hypothetical protein
LSHFQTIAIHIIYSVTHWSLIDQSNFAEDLERANKSSGQAADIHGSSGIIYEIMDILTSCDDQNRLALIHDLQLVLSKRQPTLSNAILPSLPKSAAMIRSTKRLKTAAEIEDARLKLVARKEKKMKKR